MELGDIAVTGFSGTILATEKLPPGVDPIDRTLIDPNGPAVRIFDAASLGGAPTGNLVDAPLRLDVPASQIGQVFGLTFDNGTADAPPNLYVAATSAFGLNIVGAGQAADGKPVRLKAGAPDAVFMEGQFGSLGSNSPSAIYKIDGKTGAPNYFADTAFAGQSNAGPGVGGLAFDWASRNLYASDLDTGLIHRFALDYNAADLSQYDHGIAGRRAKGLDPVADDGSHLQITDPAFKPDDPATWGITQAGAAHRCNGGARRPALLRGGRGAGDLVGRTEQRRLRRRRAPGSESQGAEPLSRHFDDLRRQWPHAAGAARPGAQPVRLWLVRRRWRRRCCAMRPPRRADTPTEERWRPEPASYAVGTADDGNAADGGVSLQYAYKSDGTLDTGVCDAGGAFG